MTESNDIIQSFVKNVFEHNDVDFEALSVATKKMAESAFEASKVNITGIESAARQMLRVLEASKKLDDKTKNQYVSDEASNLANDIVCKLEYSPTFKDCTFNINVPENSKHWTRSDVFALINIILTLVFGVINAYQNVDKENSSKPKDSTSQVDTSISDFDSILASTSKLIQSTTDNIDTIPDASRYF